MRWAPASGSGAGQDGWRCGLFGAAAAVVFATAAGVGYWESCRMGTWIANAGPESGLLPLPESPPALASLALHKGAQPPKAAVSATALPKPPALQQSDVGIMLPTGRRLASRWQLWRRRQPASAAGCAGCRPQRRQRRRQLHSAIGVLHLAQCRAEEGVERGEAACCGCRGGGRRRAAVQRSSGGGGGIAPPGVLCVCLFCC